MYILTKINIHNMYILTKTHIHNMYILTKINIHTMYILTKTNIHTMYILTKPIAFAYKLDREVAYIAQYRSHYRYRLHRQSYEC